MKNKNEVKQTIQITNEDGFIQVEPWKFGVIVTSFVCEGNEWDEVEQHETATVFLNEELLNDFLKAIKAMRKQGKPKKRGRK